MRAPGRAWHAWWFAPASGLDLGVCRLLFYAMVLGLLGTQDLAAWGSVSTAFWNPIWLFRILHLGVPWIPGVLALLVVAWRLALVLGALGLFTRASTAAAFVLGTYLLGLPHNFGKTHHYDAFIVLLLGVLACARCGDRCSLDAVRRRGDPGEAERRRRAEASGAYTWPIRMAWVVIACVLFAAGVAKLRYSGIAWITSDTMARLLVEHGYPMANVDPLTSWGPRLATYPVVTHFLAASTVAIEVLYPLALVSGIARAVLVPGGVLLVVGIRMLMGPSFETLAACALFWVPWERLAEAGGRRATRARSEREDPGPVIVLYDGTCGLCQGFVQFVLRHDARGRSRFAALQGPVAAPVLARHGLDPGVLDTVYVVRDPGGPDERLLARSAAVIGVLGWLEPPWPLLTALGWLPTPFLDAIYDLVARHRFRLMARRTHCPVPDAATRARFLDLDGEAALAGDRPGRALDERAGRVS
jgi:predicted DCC family thiol-disulfide oxidoreductase YuxK